MGDLNYIDRTGEVKIAGQDATGNGVNYVGADTHGNMTVIDYASGSATGGTAATVSSLIGGLYNTSLPTLTNGQQSAIQLDSSGRIIISPLTNASIVKAQLQDNAGTAIIVGQKVMASSVPVTLASDQTGISTFLDKNGSGTIGALNATVIATTNGCSSVTFDVTGTWAATIVIEATTGDTNWFIVNGDVDVTDSISSSFTANTFVTVSCGSFPQVRLRASLYTSGTATVNWNSSAGSSVIEVFNTNAASLLTTSRVQDGSGNAITSTLINSKQRLDINTPSEGAAGSAIPFDTMQVGGSDGTNLRALSTDSLGRLKLAGSSYFHPIFSAKVQSATAVTTVLSTSLAATIAATKAGNTIIVIAAVNAGTLTVTDSASQVYSTATTIAGNGTQTFKIFYFPNTAAGVTSVTISSTSSTDLNLIVLEYTGVLTASPLDQTSTHAQTSATTWTSNATSATAQASELLIGGVMGTLHNSGTFTPATGWNSIATVLNTRGGANLELQMSDQTVSATGTYAYTGTMTGNANDDMYAVIATFKFTTPNMIVQTNSPVTIKSSSGILRNLILNTIGTGSASVIFYDNTTNSGTVIATVALTGQVNSLEYNLVFNNGLTMVINSTSPDFTVVYD